MLPGDLTSGSSQSQNQKKQKRNLTGQSEEEESVKEDQPQAADPVELVDTVWNDDPRTEDVAEPEEEILVEVHPASGCTSSRNRKLLLDSLVFLLVYGFGYCHGLMSEQIIKKIKTYINKTIRPPREEFGGIYVPFAGPELDGERLMIAAIIPEEILCMNLSRNFGSGKQSALLLRYLMKICGGRDKAVSNYGQRDSALPRRIGLQVHLL